MCRFWLVLTLMWGAVASADTNDFQVYKLGNTFAQGTNYNPNANGDFRVFARQFAAAMTSVNLSPAETLGHSGFAFAAEISVVNFGTQEVKFPTEGEFSGTLLIPSVHVRKGLPFSFEIGARAGWIEKSRMGTGTLEFKWAINEGFSYLPDLAVRGNITKLLNARDIDLTSGGVDVGIGKQFAIGGMLTLTPYVGWNLLFVGASTSNVDFNPSRTLAEAENSAEQFKDIYVFDGVQAAANTHNRFYGGLRFIGGVVMLGAEFSYSVLGKFRDKTTGTDRNIPSVWAANAMIGLDF